MHGCFCMQLILSLNKHSCPYNVIFLPSCPQAVTVTHSFLKRYPTRQCTKRGTVREEQKDHVWPCNLTLVALVSRRDGLADFPRGHSGSLSFLLVFKYTAVKNSQVLRVNLRHLWEIATVVVQERPRQSDQIANAGFCRVNDDVWNEITNCFYLIRSEVRAESMEGLGSFALPASLNP